MPWDTVFLRPKYWSRLKPYYWSTITAVKGTQPVQGWSWRRKQKRMPGSGRRQEINQAHWPQRELLTQEGYPCVQPSAYLLSRVFTSSYCILRKSAARKGYGTKIEGIYSGMSKSRPKKRHSHHKNKRCYNINIRLCLSCDYECLLQGPETSKVPKVVRRGCKRCFGPREQRSPKSLLHHQNRVLHRCNSLLHQCKRTLALGAKKTLAPSPNHFWEFSIFKPSPRTFGSQCLSLNLLKWRFTILRSDNLHLKLWEKCLKHLEKLSQLTSPSGAYMVQTLHPPCRAPGCSYTPVAALSAVSNV